MPPPGNNRVKIEYHQQFVLAEIDDRKTDRWYSASFDEAANTLVRGLAQDCPPGSCFYCLLFSHDRYSTPVKKQHILNI